VNNVADCVIMPFEVYNEKFRGATYITVFDGICQFLTTLRGRKKEMNHVAKESHLIPVLGKCRTL